MDWINPTEYTEEQRQASYSLIRKTRSLKHLLTPFQRNLHSLIFKSEEREGALYCTRKIGKTSTILACGIEFGNNFPNTIVRIVFPDGTAGSKIIENIYNSWLKPLLPPEMRPTYFRSDAMRLFRFKNGSIIYINGAHPEHVEKARGPSCDLFLFDEIASWAGDVNYALKSIFYPQGTLTKAKKIYTTTPPEDIDCYFINSIYPRLKSKNAIFEATIYDNILLSPSEIEIIKEQMGGEESSDFQREYLLKIIPKRNRILVPEFSEDKHVWKEEPSRIGIMGEPLRYLTYITIDFGVKDATFMLAGYYDHINQKLVIIHEWIYEDTMNDYLKSIIGEHNRIFEELLIPEYLLLTSERDLSKNHTTKIDCFEQTKKSLENDHEFFAGRVKKRRVDDSIGFLRSLFVYDKILINPKCVLLIHQLKTCIWKESVSKNPEIERDNKSSEISHGDGIMSLIYMAREIDFHYFPNMKNPLLDIKFRIGDKNLYAPPKKHSEIIPSNPDTSWSRTIFRRTN